MGESEDQAVPDRVAELRVQVDELEQAREEVEGDALDAVVEQLELARAELGAAEAGQESPAEEFKPSGLELVVSDPGDEQQVFVVLDRHDEEQIIEEFQRRALKVMLYDFTNKAGKRMLDLSYQGVNEGIRLMNATGKCRIHVVPGSLIIEEVTEDIGNGPERLVIATVYARDEVTGYGQYGTSTEPAHMKLKSGGSKWDVFARTKALNKAQRNALKVMIPEAMRQTLIAMARKDETMLKQIRAGAGAAAIAELPPPLVDDEAKELRAKIEAAYRELRGVSKTAMLPAQYQHELSRAASSHELLRALLASVITLKLAHEPKAAEA